MYQTLEAMKEQGYVVDKLTPTSTGSEIVWDSENNQFVLVYENGEMYTGTTVDPTADKSKMWKVYKEMPESSEYSIYLAGTGAVATANVNGVGFDAGNSQVSTVNYSNTGSAKDVIIRTNGGVLNVNAPLDTVTHYEKADKVVITAVAGNSYHENGEVAGNIEIASGRVEVAKSAKVKGSVLVTGNGVKVDTNENNEIDVAIKNDVTDVQISGTTTTKRAALASNQTLLQSYLASSKFDIVYLNADITCDKSIDISGSKKKTSTVLDLNGHTISLGNYKFSIHNIELTIQGEGKVIGENQDDLFRIYTNSSNTFNTRLTINGGEYISKNGDIFANASEQSNKYGVRPSLIINNGIFTAKEAVVVAYNENPVEIHGGILTSKDNAVLMSNGNGKNKGTMWTITGGVFNANIESEGSIACGIYLANTDTLNVTGGIFNITNGVGIVIRGGKATIKNVEINLNNSGEIANGKVGDSKARINTSAKIVIDRFSEYPAYETIDVTAEGFTLVDANGNAVDKNGNLIA